MKSMTRMYDLIIIGAGPAGITAAIYAARRKVNTLVLSKDIGGQAATTGEIENYTGFTVVTGAELAKKFSEHIKEFDVNIKEGEEVKKVEKKGREFRVKTSKGEYEAKALIIATGAKPKKLGVPGEDEYLNKGVAYCATCDAPLFAGRDVAVVGGGNAALKSAIQLMNIAKKVYIINLNNDISGEAVMKDKVLAHKNVKIISNAKTTGIFGKKFVSGIRYEKDGKVQEIKVGGVFIEIGYVPSSDLINFVEKNGCKEIKVGCNSHTNVSGLFAAGDVSDVPYKQIIIAAGEGCKAALAAFDYLIKKKQ